MLEVISCFEIRCCILVSLAYLELRGSRQWVVVLGSFGVMLYDFDLHCNNYFIFGCHVMLCGSWCEAALTCIPL